MDYAFIDSIDSKLAEEIGELYKEAGWWKLLFITRDNYMLSSIKYW